MGINAYTVFSVLHQYSKKIERDQPTDNYHIVIDEKGISDFCRKIIALTTLGKIPMPVKVRSYNNRATVLWFADKTFTKCVVDEGTPYDLDTGITICLMKKMLGKDGSKKYNKMMHFIHDGMEIEKKQKEAAIALKKAHREENARQKAKADARKAKKRQEQIDIQVEAYRKLIREVPPYNGEGGCSRGYGCEKLSEFNVPEAQVVNVGEEINYGDSLVESCQKAKLEKYKKLRSQGKTRKEIAKIIDIPESEVRSLAAKAAIERKKDGGANE